MDALTKEGSQLASVLTGVAAGSPVHCQPCRSLKYGDLCIGRRITTAAALPEDGVMSTSDIFTSVRLNPQGQLCLSLNRPHIFREAVQEVLEKKSKYGHENAACRQSPNTADYYIHSCIVVDDDQGVKGSPHCRRQLSVTEGRILLIEKLILSILHGAGYKTQDSSFTKHVLESCVPNDVVSKFLDFSESPSTGSTSECDGDFLTGLEVSMYTFYSKPHPPHTLLCDGRRFLQEKGQQIYDCNIDSIRVKAEDGEMTTVASLAGSLWQAGVVEGEASHMKKKMIHITSHSDSFKLQQAMVLASVCAESRKQGPTTPQHIILCSDVEVLEDGTASLQDYPLASLLQVRCGQISAAFEVKYGLKAHSAEVESMVSATTEAVVKFELLATEPQSKIKLTLPSRPDSSTDVRSSGSFVLYNYARLTNLLNNFKKACDQGTYPPLPDISLIDFSLLSDDDEWYILFHYVLQYPPMTRDVTRSITADSDTIPLRTQLKKVCQFLIQLSHSVSTYYSRVKILMAPEAHLVPLVHARLFLVMAIRQTMYNALQLLAIEPPQQL